MSETWMERPDGEGWWWWRKSLKEPVSGVIETLFVEGVLKRKLFDEGQTHTEPCEEIGGRWARALPPGPDADRDAADLAALREIERQESACVFFAASTEVSVEINDDGNWGHAATLAEAVAAVLKARDGGEG